MKKQKITRKQFLLEVRKELKYLRTHATKTEINRLKIEKLRPTDSSACIYGLMTGDCQSNRAAELYSKGFYGFHNYACRRITAEYTALEVYIVEYKEYNVKNIKHLHHILRYLKGELTRVTLK